MASINNNLIPNIYENENEIVQEIDKNENFRAIDYFIVFFVIILWFAIYISTNSYLYESHIYHSANHINSNDYIDPFFFT